MARKRKSDIILPAEKDREAVIGGRLLSLLDEQLADLAKVQVHGNRKLLANHVVVAHLIAFFNAAVASLRTVEDVFEHEQVRRQLRLPRIPKSTLADTQRAFDLTLLQPLVDDLAQRLDLPRHPQLDNLTRQIVAVDATVFRVASRIAWALPRNTTSGRGALQMCLHFDVLHGTPVGFTLIGGQQSERTQLPAAIASGRLYLLDRAYQSYDHLNQILAADSDFLVRLRCTANFTVIQERPLSADDRRAGVVRDAVVRPTDRHHRFAQPVRLVEIATPDGDECVRLLTNRQDLSAELIGLLYRHRWQIELFFRWLKCVTGLRHFMSESPTGMAVQLYVAMIGTLLVALESEARPSKYDFAQMQLAVSGAVSLASAKAVMARRRKIAARDAERARARARAKKQG